jgi:hypothetical protein
MSGHQAIIFRASLMLALALSLPSCGGGGSSGSGLTGIDVSPLSQSIPVGATLQYKATGHFNNGPDQDLTGNATWSSSVTSVATIENVGIQPGLATGVAAGQTNITASFAQGSSSVSGSTDLTVTAAQGALREDGTASVLFRLQSPLARSEVKVDGRMVEFSDGGFATLELPAGVHRFVSAGGTHTFTSNLRAGRTYSFEVAATGKLALVDPEASSRD